MAFSTKLDEPIEEAISQISEKLAGSYDIPRRAVATMLLEGDPGITEEVRRIEGERFPAIHRRIDKTAARYDRPLSYVITVNRQESCFKIADEALLRKAKVGRKPLRETLATLTTHPVAGVPILVLVVYFGLYQFVGVFGAQILVDLLEVELFEGYINPWVNNVVERFLPWVWAQDLLAHEYGVITLGVRYAVALILPIVATFSLLFSVIEDSGYLPRLAMLLDRVFKRIGLNGRAVIPMTLGFGCDTMATVVTRTLETKRERLIANFLLALAIPCSAQLGVIIGLLSPVPGALAVWGIFLMGVFLLVGFLTAQILPGRRPNFYMELPPLRVPKLSNVLQKSYTRVHWYFKEVFPLFVLASIFIWLGNLTGLFGLVLEAIRPLVNAIGLPDETARAFLFGFFRRDYGAAGLFDLQRSGLLSPRQLVVAAATLTLFVPCVAQFAITIRERGWKTAVAMGSIIFPFAFLVGFLLNQLLTALRLWA